MDTIALEVSGARKRFGSTDALAGASFQVKRGELLGLLGPNGAGKTTMIRAIAGRVALDEGTISVFGRVVGRRDQRPEIGVVPQELAVYPLLTARENLEVFGALYGVQPSTLRERVDWALEWSDLKDRAKEPIKQFSGGMKRRLNIAVGLLHSPQIVLLDEPTVGVDPQSRERIYEMLAALQQSGVAVVLTTHHLEEAEKRCERIVIIDHGVIVASGTLAELVAASRKDSSSVRLVVKTAAGDVDRQLAALSAAGVSRDAVEIQGGSLQDVFIGLTGRDLRE
jgi:ABC-2 type transport system ATP-binding protein